MESGSSCCASCGRRAGGHSQRERAPLVEAERVDAVDDDLAGQLRGQGREQVGMTVVRHSTITSSAAAASELLTPTIRPEPSGWAYLGGDELRSLRAPAPNEHVMPGCGKSCGQTTTLRPGAAEDSDLHADVRRHLTK